MHYRSTNRSFASLRILNFVSSPKPRPRKNARISFGAEASRATRLEFLSTAARNDDDEPRWSVTVTWKLKVYHTRAGRTIIRIEWRQRPVNRAPRGVPSPMTVRGRTVVETNGRFWIIYRIRTRAYAVVSTIDYTTYSRISGRWVFFSTASRERRSRREGTTWSRDRENDKRIARNDKLSGISRGRDSPHTTRRVR